METLGAKNGMRKSERFRFRWRVWFRVIHRDIGYFSVGLTLVYALSGLAVNHIADWEPNFRQVTREADLVLPSAADEQTIARLALAALDLDDPVREVFRENDAVELVLDQGSVRVDTRTGHAVASVQEARFFLRAANWLHLNRGKKAWTVVADTYAVFLLLLSFTGLWMFSGRKGILGRAGVIAAAGALVPILYVALSGGP
jgi:uncharacterized protein